MSAFLRRSLLLPVALLLTAAGGLGPQAGAAGFTDVNDFGSVGLLQTPTARFSEEGTFGFGLSVFDPYHQIQLFAQPLPFQV